VRIVRRKTIVREQRGRPTSSEDRKEHKQARLYPLALVYKEFCILVLNQLHLNALTNYRLEDKMTEFSIVLIRYSAVGRLAKQYRDRPRSLTYLVQESTTSSPRMVK